MTIILMMLMALDCPPQEHGGWFKNERFKATSVEYRVLTREDILRVCRKDNQRAEPLACAKTFPQVDGTIIGVIYTSERPSERVLHHERCHLEGWDHK